MARPLRASESVSAEISRNLALELVRVTEAGALASARWMGRGDKNTADGAAVDDRANSTAGRRGTLGSRLVRPAAARQDHPLRRAD